MDRHTITTQRMPKDGCSVSTTYPWGMTLTITRTGGDYRDLSSQSTRFEWETSAGDRGHFYAIGGLCGSFEDCYYPIVRRIESGLVRTIVIKDSSVESWSPDWEVKTDALARYVVAVKTQRYGGYFHWLQDPIALPAVPLEPWFPGSSQQQMALSQSLYSAIVGAIAQPA